MGISKRESQKRFFFSHFLDKNFFNIRRFLCLKRNTSFTEIKKHEITQALKSIRIMKFVRIWRLHLTPQKKNRYIELKKNPNPKRSDKAYVRKYIRKDPIRTRGQLLKKFNLSEEDLKEIEEYILNNRNKKC